MFSELSSLTGYFKVLADETRVKILHLLSTNELTVGELVDILDMNQSAVSNQLAALKKSGFIAGRKEGNRVFYSLSSDFEESSRFTLYKEAVENRADSALFDQCDRGLKEVLEQRRRESVKFFEELEEKDSGCNSRITPLSLTLARISKGLKIVDMGCGSGELALMLANSGNDVIGIDNSQKRISMAQEKFSQFLSDNKGENKFTGSLQFVNSDIENSGLPDGSAERVILSHTLHHIAYPQDALNEAYRILDKNGRIVILDLNSYDNEQIKEEQGDFWMGFSPENLTQMLKKAGFTSVRIDEQQDPEKKHGEETLILIADKGE